MTVTPPRTGADGAVTLPPARSGDPGPVQDHAELAPVSRKFLARATLVTAVLSIAGALLGLARDQALARLFGAGSETDAFLVAWTVPEFASTLLIEDGLAFALVPAFSLALARRAQGAPGDPVRSLVATTLPRLTLALVGAAALVVAGAPYLVEALAPGLPDPALAVDCTRLTATCVLSFGLAGYCSAALRAHRRFLAPAAIYVAYNTGIITAMFVLGGHWGVRSAAVGVAVGGVLMFAVQLPFLLRQLRRKAAVTEQPGPADGQAVTLALVATVLLFALCRQSQVLIERFLASTLPAGSISHLNYAQKVAQIPMTLSLMLCTVTFPVVARALAEGDVERARTRVERDLALAACVVLVGAATVIACAPQIVEVLFQRGAFTAKDTAATAGVMRVYALGLLGQTLVGALVRSYFSAGRPTWFPVAVMTVGIVVTSWVGVWTVRPWGVCGIAAANAAGITVTAVLLLAGMGERRSVPIRVRRVLHELSRPVRAAAVATVAGAFVAARFDSALPGLAAGGATVVAVFVLLGRALGAQGLGSVTALPSALRRLARTLSALPIRPRGSAGRTARRPAAGRRGSGTLPPHPPSTPYAPSHEGSAMSVSVETGPRSGSRPGPVPWVAMYHSVGDCSDDPYRITVTPDRLDEQLDRLGRRGLRGVSMADLLAARARGEGQDLVGLTFDDGYADFVAGALPVLRRHGCGATLFVLPGRLGGDNDWDPLGPRKPLLTADGIRRAAEAGIEIGSHGLTHIDLTRADDSALRAETVESRALLSELTGAPVEGFCYPYGRVDQRAVDAVRAAGYTYACAIDPGPLSSLHALPRVHIGQNDTAVRLYLKHRLHRLRRRPVAGLR